jgi:hypothetical protein
MKNPGQPGIKTRVKNSLIFLKKIGENKVALIIFNFFGSIELTFLSSNLNLALDRLLNRANFYHFYPCVDLGQPVTETLPLLILELSFKTMIITICALTLTWVNCQPHS